MDDGMSESDAVLNGNMCFSCELMSLLLARSAVASQSGDVAELDLMARWPVLAAAILVAGLVADVWLAWQWWQRRKTASAPLWRVGTKPWGLSELFVAVGVTLAVFLSVGIVGGLLRLRATGLLALLGATELGLLLVFLICLEVERVDFRHAFGLTESSVPHALWMGGVFFLAVQPPLLVLSTLRDKLYAWLGWQVSTQDIVRMFLTADSRSLTVVLVGFALLVAPVCEEAFFRGLAYPALKKRWGVPTALVVVSALFALIHFHGPSLPLLFVLAVGLTLAYEYTGSLLTPIAMHAAFNSLNVMALLLYRSHP